MLQCIQYRCRSRLVVIIFICFHLVPGIPQNLAATNISSTELIVTWTEPLRRNGRLKDNTVYYRLVQYDNNTRVENKTWESRKTTLISLTLSGLGKLNVNLNIILPFASNRSAQTFLRVVLHSKRIRLAGKMCKFGRQNVHV